MPSCCYPTDVVRMLTTQNVVGKKKKKSNLLTNFLHLTFSPREYHLQSITDIPQRFPLLFCGVRRAEYATRLFLVLWYYLGMRQDPL